MRGRGRLAGSLFDLVFFEVDVLPRHGAARTGRFAYNFTTIEGSSACADAGGWPDRYLILCSLKSTCFRATGSYFLKTSFSV